MRIHTGRFLIGAVLIINVQCAIAFFILPGNFASSFELDGALGEMVIRATGVLFLMWNVPYAVALWHPVRYRVSLYEALVMQTIGLAGETVIFFLLPVAHVVARASIARFILFDALGLVALLAAAWLTHKIN